MNNQSNNQQEAPMSKTWTRKEINELLTASDMAVMRAIVRLFEMQTEDESRVGLSKHKNNRGFCACDAKAGTRMARWLLGMNDRNQVLYPPKDLRHPLCQKVLGRYVQGRQEKVIDRARKIALKHSTQLTSLANEQ